MSQYAFGRTVELSFDEALRRVSEALAKEGFGILTEIDVSATLQKKLGVHVPPYRILGACNPQFAHRALEAEPQIGALLPCNVVLRTGPEGKTIVEMMDPLAVMKLVDRPEIALIATEVKERLSRALRSL
jgi:uncharacterized protein (DUF302 family)